MMPAQTQEHLRRGRPAQRLAETLDALARECAALPDLDTQLDFPHFWDRTIMS